MRYAHGADGNVAATIDSAGRITLGIEPGEIVGVIRADTEVFLGEAGVELLGHIDEERRVWDAQHERAGTVDASGRVTDPTGKVVGYAQAAADGAALLLLVARLNPEALSQSPPPPAMTTMMDDVMALAEEDKGPRVKHYRKLTDEEVFGKPYKKQ